jgi:antitoxin HicB
MWEYPITLEPDDNDTILVSFPDVPEAHTFGDDEDEARARAVDVLATVLQAYIRDRQAIPRPSAVKAGEGVRLPALMAMKVALYEAARNAGVGKAELARKLNWHLPQVDRLFDLGHASRVDQVEAALGVLGMVLNADVARAPEVKPRRLGARSRRSRKATTQEFRAAAGRVATKRRRMLKRLGK